MCRYRVYTAWIVCGLSLQWMLLSACIAAQQSPPVTPAGTPAISANSVADEEWNKVVEAAKAEGEVIVWTQVGEDRRRFYKDAFERAYPGIRVNLFQAPQSAERDARFLQEWRAGVAKVDVMISGSAGVNARIKPEGGLQPLRPLLRPEILDPAVWRLGILWVDKEQQYMLMSDTSVYPPVTVNHTIAESELQSWEDLLNPRYKGRIVQTDPRSSGPGFAAGLFMYYHPDLGPEFVRELYNKGVIFSPDERQNAEWIDSGRMLIGISARPQEVEALRKIGGTLRIVPVLKIKGRPEAFFQGSDGILFVPNLDPLPHPNAARVYVNWFYSREGQQAMADILQLPSNRVDVDLSNVPQYTIPQHGVEYTNMNEERFTSTESVQQMRDYVNRVYVAP
jgi:iron(III) transport system substrate-binding protein